MIRLILALFLVPIVLLGNLFDPTVLQIGAKIFPKVVLIEKGTKERIDGSVNILIVANDSTKETAQRLAGFIDRQYKNQLGGYLLNVRVISPQQAIRETDVHGYILLLTGKETLFYSLLAHAQKTKTLTFSLDPELLSQGVAVSLYIGRNVKPYLNLSLIRETPFVFDYGFLKLSQPYTVSE